MAARGYDFSAVDDTCHIWVLCFRCFFVFDQVPRTSLLVRLVFVPVVITLDQLITLVIHQVALVWIAGHKVSSSFALLLCLGPLRRPLVDLMLQIESVVPWLMLPVLLIGIRRSRILVARPARTDVTVLILSRGPLMRPSIVLGHKLLFGEWAAKVAAG